MRQSDLLIAFVFTITVLYALGAVEVSTYLEFTQIFKPPSIT
jgi:hypothetical protein